MSEAAELIIRRLKEDRIAEAPTLDGFCKYCERSQRAVHIHSDN